MKCLRLMRTAWFIYRCKRQDEHHVSECWYVVEPAHGTERGEK